MATQTVNYKCPNCDGPLHFVGESGKLECDYCASKFDVSEIEALYAEAERRAQENAKSGGWDVSSVGSDWGSEGANMRAYSCPSCGAELICDATTAATSCPYCGNPTVVPGQFGGTLKPDYIIPFKLDKNAAKEALKKHYLKKPLLPNTFRDENHIEEIKGVYVPFWLFDAKAHAHVAFEGTRTHSHREGKYEVTVTDHYDVRRDGSVDFKSVPVDGATKMPDEHMDSIEPFDYGELKPFSTAYMPGFLADKYDVSAADSAKRADERVSKSAVDCMANTVTGYDTCVIQSQEVKLQRGQVKYALLPVWMLSTKWDGKSFLFAMNGQTGRLIGDLPVDKKKYWLWFGSVFLGGTALLTLLLSLVF